MKGTIVLLGGKAAEEPNTVAIHVPEADDCMIVGGSPNGLYVTFGSDSGRIIRVLDEQEVEVPIHYIAKMLVAQWLKSEIRDDEGELTAFWKTYTSQYWELQT